MRPVVRSKALMVLMALALMGSLAPTIAQEQSERAAIVFDIPPQSMADALQAFAKQADLQILFKPESVGALQTPGLSGRLTVKEALDALLKGTGLEHVRNGDVVVVRVPNGSPGMPAASESSRAEPNGLAIAQVGGAAEGRAEAPIRADSSGREGDTTSQDDTMLIGESLVTGTLIRGAQSASPLIILARDEILMTGYTTVQQVIDRLPQNYGGGDSEGTALSPGGSPLNVGMGSAVNLRGLGSDATLVLLDGRRMAPAAFGQFVDVSMIPLTAIERIEVLTDGASATYGSDAVAGVVNIILRDDYDGAETRLQFGSATEGGIEEVQVGQSLGHDWGSGGALLTYEYYERGNLDSTDRDFSRDVLDPYDLLAEQERQSLLGAIHQELSETTRLRGNVLFSQRDALWLQANFFTGEPQRSPTQTRQVSASIAALTEFGESWRAEFAASYGRNDTHRDVYTPTAVQRGERNQFDVTTADLTLDGTAFQFRGAPVKLAIGAGWRNEGYDPRRAGFTARDRDVGAGFVEAVIPLIGRESRQSLELSLAGRYEHYSDFGSSTNPKLGLVWEPTANVRLRSSWGTSFRAPIFNELDDSNATPVLLELPDPNATDGTTLTMFLNGNNPELQPEEATTFTVGFDLALDPSDAELSMTYFDTQFEERIVQPLPGAEFFTIFSQEEIYASIITREPDDAFIAELAAHPNFQNGFGPFVPADVAAYFDRRLQNLSLTDVSGLDVAASIKFETRLSEFGVGINGSYLLDFTDAVSDSAPDNDILDAAFHPIDLKLRASFTWQHGPWGASAFAHYSDGYTNDTVTPAEDIDSWTTLDLQLTYTAPWLEGVRFALSAANVFDEDPPFVSSPLALFDVGYDPTNASPVGRFLSLGVTASW